MLFFKLPIRIKSYRLHDCIDRTQINGLKWDKIEKN